MRRWDSHLHDAHLRAACATNAARFIDIVGIEHAIMRVSMNTSKAVLHGPLDGKQPSKSKQAGVTPDLQLQHEHARFHRRRRRRPLGLTRSRTHERRAPHTCTYGRGIGGRSKRGRKHIGGSTSHTRCAVHTRLSPHRRLDSQTPTWRGCVQCVSEPRPQSANM